MADRIPIYVAVDPDSGQPSALAAFSTTDVISETVGGTGRTTLSGLITSVDNVPVNYNSTTRQFTIGTVEAEAVVDFENIRDAFSSGTGTLTFGGDIVTSGTGKFRGNFSGNLEGNADTATNAIFSVEALVIRDVRFNGIEIDVSGGADVTVSASEIAFSAIQKAFASGTGDVGFGGGNFVLSGGAVFSGNLSGNSNYANLAGSATSALSATEATIVRNVKFNGTSYNLSSDVDVTIAGGGAVEYSSVSAVLASGVGPLSFHDNTLSDIGSLSANNVTGTNIRGTTSVSSPSVSGTSVRAGSLEATGNTTLAAVTGTTGRFTTDLSSASVTGTTVVGTTSVRGATVSATTSFSGPAATITNFTGTNLSATGTLNVTGNTTLAAVTGTTGRFTTDLSSASVSGEVGRFTTSLSSNSITGITLAGTTGNITTLNATSLSGTNISGTTGRFTTDLSSASVTGTDIVGTTSIRGATVSATTSFSGPAAIITNFTGTNLSATGTLNVTGNTSITGTLNTTGNITTTAVVQGGTLNSTGNITATGTVNGADGRFTTSVSSAAVSGNTARFNTDVSSASITGTTLAGTTGNITTVNATNVTGASVTATNFTATNNVTVTGSITATGNISTTTGTVTAANIRGTTSVSSASVTGTEVVGATGRFTTSVSSASVTGTTVNAGGLNATGNTSITGTLNVTGDTTLAAVTGTTGRFTSNVSAVSVSGETAYFTTISATTYQGYPTGGGDSNATSIQGVQVLDPTIASDKAFLRYRNNGVTETLLWSYIIPESLNPIPVENALTVITNDSTASATGTSIFNVVSGIKIPPTTVIADGQTLVASGSSGTLVAATLVNGVSRIPSGLVQPLPYSGSLLFYNPTESVYFPTQRITIPGLIADMYVSGGAGINIYGGGDLNISGGSDINLTGTLYASTVSATNYRNIRPYVSAVDSATTTTVNMGGDYDLYLVNTTTTSVTLYLPDASAWTSKQITVSKVDDGGSYRSVTLSGTTLQTATQTVRLYDPTESVTVISNGTNWYSLDYDRAYGVVVVAKNNTGSTLAKGTPVRVTGALGDNVLIGPVSAANNHVPEAPNGSLSKCIGVVEHSIPDGEFGHVLTKGTLYKFDTSAYTEGDQLYLASGGGFTNVKPPSPYDEVFLGIVTRQSVNNGSILIDVENPIHINDIAGVNLTSGIINGDLISYDSTTSTFTNVQSVNVSGQGKFGSVSATIVSAAEAIYIDGATGYIINPSGNITLSSVNGVIATNGTMNVANGSGNIFLRAGRAAIYTDTAASAYYIATNNYADPRANYIVAQTSAGDSYLGAKSGQTLSIVVPSKTVSSIVTADKLVEVASTSVTVRTPLISTTSIEAVSVSATNYLNLPQSDASSLNGYAIDVGSVPLSNGDILAWDTINSYYTIVPSSTFAGGGGGAPTTAQYLTLATDATLTNERVLTVGAGLGSLNGGAGGNFTLSAVYTSAIWNANKLQGYDVSSVAPSNNQILSYNTTVSAWVPVTTSSTGISQAAAMTIVGFGGF